MVRNTDRNNKKFQKKTLKQLINKYGTIFCKCGCGKEIVLKWQHKYNRVPKYISGHNNTGKKFTKLHRENMSSSMNKGKTRLIVLLRSELKYKEWRNAIFKRDNYICQISNIKGGGKLEAHHIKNLSNILKENNIKNIKDAYNCEDIWDTDNGITLLKPVHKIFHLLYGKRKNNKEQLTKLKNDFPSRIGAD